MNPDQAEAAEDDEAEQDAPSSTIADRWAADIEFERRYALVNGTAPAPQRQPAG